MPEFIRRSILLKQLLPYPILGGIFVVIFALVVPGFVKNAAVEDAARTAQATIEQFKTIRGYYTQNVIKKAKTTGGLIPMIDHKNAEDGIPLPATMIHDLGRILKERGTSLDLYSKFPFPNRKDRKLDDFQSRAWDGLNKKPKDAFVEYVEQDGKKYVRVAKADFMSAQGCVDCHNGHPDTPKNDWKLGDVRGVLEVKVDVTNAIADWYNYTFGIIGAIAVAGVLMLLVGVIMTRNMCNIFHALTARMTAMTDGNLDVHIPAQDKVDEIGIMARALKVFKERLIEIRKMEQDQEAQKQRALEEKKVMMNKMADDFETSVGHVISTVSSAATELETSARSMQGIADQTSSQATTVAAAAEEASVNVQTVASATEELAASQGEIGNNVQRSSEATRAANEKAQATHKTVSELVGAVEKISEVTELISDIAEQTNLLALNATIEAARAGEAGKGFAVVASEVKNLANQTARATEDITNQIAQVQTVTGEAAKAMEDIGNTIADVDQIAQSISAAIEQQTAATHEIAQNVDQASAGTAEVSQTILNVTQAANETGAASGEILGAAQELSTQSEKLRDEVDKFIATIRNS